jgi:hypothetical protein
MGEYRSGANAVATPTLPVEFDAASISNSQSALAVKKHCYNDRNLAQPLVALRAITYNLSSLLDDPPKAESSVPEKGDRYMRKGFGALLVAAFCATALQAQDKAQQQPPRTRIEAFEGKTGSVIIRGFSKVGELRGALGGGILTLQSMEFSDAVTGQKEYGIAIDIKETDRLERSHRSFIDFDEIDSLLKGIDYISKIDKSSTTLDNFQADFRTKGELVITTFSTSRGESMASIGSGSIGKTEMFLRLADLVKLREFVATGKTTLEALKKR